MKSDFNFKQLEVWKQAIEFADFIIAISEELKTPKNHFRLIEQIESCSASIAQNIAEGKGRTTDKDFARFLSYSRGSLYETLTLLHLFHKRGWISTDTLNEAEEKASIIGKMINALLNKLKQTVIPVYQND
jgi:four helix bundle protein